MKPITLWKIILVLAVLHFQNNAFAQDVKEDKSWIVKLNTTALVDAFSFPTVQFAVEKKINNAFSIQTEMGYQLYDFRKIDTASVNTNGYKLNAEVRFYPFSYFKKDKTRKSNSDGIYTGLQAFYRKNKYNAHTEYYESEYDYQDPVKPASYEDNFGVIKSAYGWNVALGYQKKFQNLIIEPYLYLGLMTKSVKNKDREYDEDLGHEPNNGPHDYYGYFDLEESSGTDFNFAFGFRIGYQF